MDKELRPAFLKWLRADYIDNYDVKHRILYTKEKCPTMGSKVEFMSYDQEADVYAGGTRDVLLCDEPPAWMPFNESRARLRAAKGRILIGMTPEKNNPNVRWIFMKLVEPGLCSVYYAGSQELAVLLHGEDGAKAVMKRVFGDLSPEEKTYRMFGKFPTLGGVIYPTFKKTIAPHGHLVRDFDIPDDWMTVMAMDYHKRKPCYATWCAINTHGTHFFYREYVSNPDATIPQIADDIAKLENGRVPSFRLIDPSAAEEATRMDTRERTAVREFSRYMSGGRSIIFRPAIRSVQIGIDSVEQRLRFDDKGMPGVMFFQEAMKGTVEEIMHYIWDDPADHRGVKDLREQPLKKDDHFADCVRYIAIMRFKYRHPFLMRARFAGEQNES